MRVNEIFYSLQGEGYHTGAAAVFVRLSGCNLRCPFCDTDHEEGREMSENEIAEEAGRYPARLVVVTGGEPTLQLTATLVEALHARGKKVAVETNGTLPPPPNVDWVTLSPKESWLGAEARPVIARADELKVLFDGVHLPPSYDTVSVDHRFLQPCDTGDAQRNAAITEQTIEYIKSHPEWRLSLQIHKTVNIK